jgi:hypothetical protein
VADTVASTMGSWTFILIQTAILLAWIVLNVSRLPCPLITRGNNFHDDRAIPGRPRPAQGWNGFHDSSAFPATLETPQGRADLRLIVRPRPVGSWRR